ncbi:MAG: DUF423 domain-containing protein [Amphritea sp.]
MSARVCFIIAAVSGFIVVTLGAFASHMLRGTLSDRLYDVFQTGVQYQMFHTLALLLVGVLLDRHRSKLLSGSALLFALGILLFSGSLYLLAISGTRWLGAITPLGGVLFLSGWLMLAIAQIRRRESDS